MDSLKDARIADLGAKLLDAKQALAKIRPGSQISLEPAAAPRSLIAGLESMASGPPDLEFVSFDHFGPARRRQCLRQYRHRTFFFVGSDVRGWPAATGSTTCRSAWRKSELLATGRLPIDVALLQVSLP